MSGSARDVGQGGRNVAITTIGFVFSIFLPAAAATLFTVGFASSGAVNAGEDSGRPSDHSGLRGDGRQSSQTPLRRTCVVLGKRKVGEVEIPMASLMVPRSVFTVTSSTARLGLHFT
jgi:hypothetical protein